MKKRKISVNSISHDSDNPDRDFDRLKSLGFNFKNSNSEFSLQPDSGSLVGGKRGEQEYGITADFDAQDRRGQRSLNPGEIILSYGPDDTSRGQEAALERIEQFGPLSDDELSDFELERLIERRIVNHPGLNDCNLEVEVKNHAVTICGMVASQADKVRLNELIESLPSVHSIRNIVDIAHE